MAKIRLSTLTAKQKDRLRLIDELIIYGDEELDEIEDAEEYNREIVTLSSLEKKGLIYQDDYGDYRTTEEGSEAVQRIIRRYHDNEF